MNKTELVAAMAKETNLSKKDVEDVLKSFVDVVSKELKNGGKIQLVGFGTFEVSERAAREGRNPQTGETMKIEASKSPKFKAGKALKDMGLTMSSAITMFLDKVSREKRIPFEITADPFYSESNIRYLEKIAADIKNGKATFSEHALIDGED